MRQILAHTKATTPETQAQAVRKAAEKDPWCGANDPRIKILWRALTVTAERPPLAPATLQALAAGFAGAHGGLHVRDIIDQVVEDKNHLNIGTHIPFLAGCLSEWPEIRTQGGPEDRLALQIKWIQGLQPLSMAASCRLELLTALIREREMPEIPGGPRISTQDLGTILNAITGPDLEAATDKERLRVQDLCLKLLPQELHNQVDQHFTRTVTASSLDFKHRPPTDDTPSALKRVAARPPRSTLSPMKSPASEGKYTGPRRWVLKLPDGQEDRALTQRAGAITATICRELERPAVGAEPNEARLALLAKAAWRADDPPRTAGAVLQMLLQVLPQDPPAGLHAALKVLAHLPDPQEMSPWALDSLVDALSISPHISHETAQAMMDTLVRELGGTAMPAPLLTCIAKYFKKGSTAKPERLVALEAGAFQGGGLARPHAATQSSSLDPPHR